MVLFLVITVLVSFLPLLKNKHGDASKFDMYRCITVSCSFSKLFESVLSSVFDQWLTVDDLQYVVVVVVL